MSALFDTNSIRNNNPPERVLSLLNIPFLRRGDHLKADCPNCGKKNKFSFSSSKGLYNCFSGGCDLAGAGVIDFVMDVLQRDFVEACKFLGGAKDLTPSEKREAEAKQKEWAAKAKREEMNKLRRTKKQMENILAVCQPGENTLAQTYLETRGHSLGLKALGWPETLWFHPGLEAFVGEGKDKKPAGTFPAMIAKGHDAKGKLVVLHRTYLTQQSDGRVMKAAPDLTPDLLEDWNAKQMVGVLSRCDRGVYLGASAGVTDDPCQPIIVAEGIESTLAMATAGVKGAFYAALSLDRIIGRMSADGSHQKGWLPPAEGRPVIIAADNDLSPVPPKFDCGIERAQTLFKAAGERLVAAGFNTGIWFAPKGCDPEDALFESPKGPEDPLANNASSPQTAPGADSAAISQSENAPEENNEKESEDA